VISVGMAFLKRDMVFCVLFVGDENLIRHLVTESAQRLEAFDWMEGIRCASLVRLRAMFFLLVDRDSSLKQRLLEEWPQICLQGMEPGKANYFFKELRGQAIDPWMMDERRSEDDLVSSVVDLYLVS
jgi:hypothetical protein